MGQTVSKLASCDPINPLKQISNEQQQSNSDFEQKAKSSVRLRYAIEA